MPAKKRRRKDQDPRPRAPDTGMPPRPEGDQWLPMKEFLASWWKAYRRVVFPRSTAKGRIEAGPGEAAALEAAMRPVSGPQKLLKVINATRPFLVALGVLLLLWLVVDLPLRFTLPAAQYAAVDAVAGPIVAVVAPAVVGYWTNYIAITMLFHPRRKNAVWVGIIPSRKEELTALIAESVKERLVSPEIIREYLHETGAVRAFIERNVKATTKIVLDDRFREELKELAKEYAGLYLTDPKIHEHVDSVVQRKIDEVAGVGVKGAIIRWVRKKQKGNIRHMVEDFMKSLPEEVDEVFGVVEVLLDEVPGHFIEHVDFLEEEASKAISAALDEVDVANIVKRQFEKMDEDRIEQMLKGPLQQEIVFIQTGGGVLGLLLGLAIVFPLVGRIVVLGLGVTVAVVMVATMEKDAPA